MLHAQCKAAAVMGMERENFQVQVVQGGRSLEGNMVNEKRCCQSILKGEETKSCYSLIIFFF